MLARKLSPLREEQFSGNYWKCLERATLIIFSQELIYEWQFQIKQYDIVKEKIDLMIKFFGLSIPEKKVLMRWKKDSQKIESFIAIQLIQLHLKIPKLLLLIKHIIVQLLKMYIIEHLNQQSGTQVVEYISEEKQLTQNDSVTINQKFLE